LDEKAYFSLFSKTIALKNSVGWEVSHWGLVLFMTRLMHYHNSFGPENSLPENTAREIISGLHGNYEL
jgi:hypothetical protein